MTLRIWLSLFLIAFAAPLSAERTAAVFFFGNDTIAPAESTANVPAVLARMADAEGVTLSVDGTSGTLTDFARNLPPPSDWRIEGVTRRMSDNPRSFRMAGFDAVVLAPGEIGEDSETLVRRIFDWAGRQGVHRFLLYEDGPGVAALALTVQDAVPGASVGLIPAAQAMAAAGVTEGSDAAALVATMATWSGLFQSAAPALTLPDTLTLPSDQAALAESIWLRTAGAVAPEGASLTAPATGHADPSLAFGLTGIADWSSEMPFIDVMKTARPWIGHLPDRWGGVTTEELRTGGYLSPEGWPLAIPEGVEALESLVLTDLSPEATDTAGRYVLRWQGEGTLSLTGRAHDIVTGSHVAHFSFTPGEGLVGVRVTAVDAADPIRNITMMREDHAALARAGAVFNPDFLTVVQDARMLRFMDWMATNNSDQATWDDRPRPEDATWARRGVPIEVMVELANRIGIDPWFTLPHMADDDYVQRFAQYVHDHLRSDLRVQAEWSNEVWNFIFGQAYWAHEQAAARWGEEAAEGDGWIQFAGSRAAEVADIWTGVFADDPARLVRVVATHTGWPGVEAALLEAPLRQAEGLPAPVESFDAYAVSGYIGFDLEPDAYATMVQDWLAGDDATAQITTTLRDWSLADLTGRLWPYHAQVATTHGLRLMMYEGGSHLVAPGSAGEDAAINDFLISYSYSPEMAALYSDLLGAWQAIGKAQPVGPFNAFVAISPPSRWGSWGARRHTGDINPRWATLAAWNSLPFGEDRGNALRHGVLLQAGEDGATLEGTEFADTLIGGPGDDVILAGGGADLIAGGAGHARVVLPGKAADWAPAVEDDILWMIGTDAEVRLVDVEEVTFSDEPDAVLMVARLARVSGAGRE